MPIVEQTTLRIISTIILGTIAANNDDDDVAVDLVVAVLMKL
jgi:hypothetical protein